MLHAALLIIGVTMSVPPPKLSEIRVDSLPPLTDAEYIELIGVAGFSLDGFSIVVIGDDDSAIGPELGNSGVLEAVISLDGQIIPADRSFLIHASPALPMQADLDAVTGLEDADNLTVLLVRQCKAHAGDDLDLDNDGVLDIEPWSELIDGVSIMWGAPGVHSEWTYASAQVGPNGGFLSFKQGAVSTRILGTSVRLHTPQTQLSKPQARSILRARAHCVWATSIRTQRSTRAISYSSSRIGVNSAQWLTSTVRESSAQGTS